VSSSATCRAACHHNSARARISRFGFLLPPPSRFRLRCPGFPRPSACLSPAIRFTPLLKQALLVGGQEPRPLIARLAIWRDIGELFEEVIDHPIQGLSPKQCTHPSPEQNLIFDANGQIASSWHEKTSSSSDCGGEASIVAPAGDAW
jgi:hypothetical protein